MRIGYPGKRGDAPAEFLGHPQIRLPIIADGANVDLRRHPEIEDSGHDVGRLKVEGFFRKRRGQDFAQLAHIISRRPVPFLQRNQDHSVIDADGRAVRERQIVGTRRQPDIVDDAIALSRGDDLADLVFDRLEDRFGRFDPRSGGGANVELNLTSADERKEVVAD